MFLLKGDGLGWVAGCWAALHLHGVVGSGHGRDVFFFFSLCFPMRWMDGAGEPSERVLCLLSVLVGVDDSTCMSRVVSSVWEGKREGKGVIKSSTLFSFYWIRGCAVRRVTWDVRKPGGSFFFFSFRKYTYISQLHSSCVMTVVVGGGEGV